MRLDPFAAALRGETTVYQLLLIGGVAIGLTSLHARLATRPHHRVAALLGVVVVLVALSFESVVDGFWGPVLAVAGGAAIAVGRVTRRLSARAAALAIVVVGLLAAYQTGVEFGLRYRDRPALHQRLAITTRAPIAGLGGGVERAGSWQYDGLYLVFRDEETVFVGRRDQGGTVWLVSMSQVVSLALEPAR